MTKKDIIILCVVVVALMLSKYRKYIKNSGRFNSKGKDIGSSGSSNTFQKDDDYEPYSGK
jgi:hypothetical protein